MKQHDMKMSKKAAEKLGGVPVSSGNRDEYPYGLRLSLGNDELAKLSDVASGDVGETVIIMATGTITSKSKNEQQNGKPDQRMEIQIKSIGVECRKSGDNDDERYLKSHRAEKITGRKE